MAIGVRKQAEADIQMPIMSGRGEMPPPTAMGRASGAIRAAVAVLDMKLVSSMVSAQDTNISMVGPDTLETTAFATSAAAPDFCIAADMDSIPANRKMVTQSMQWNASFMVMQRVATTRHAPSTAAVVRGSAPVTIMMTTKAKIPME